MAVIYVAFVIWIMEQHLENIPEVIHNWMVTFTNNPRLFQEIRILPE